MTKRREEAMQIIVGRESLKHVVPADAEAYAQASTSPEQIWEELTERNGGLATNVQRAHEELKCLINLAAEAAQAKNILLYEVELVCPQLMSFEGWSNYAENIHNSRFSAHQLRIWFIMYHGASLLFHIDSAEGRVLISFSPRVAPKHKFWWRFDY